MAGRQRPLLRHADGRPRAGDRDQRRSLDATALLVLNAHHDVVTFTLPEGVGGCYWRRLLDTNVPDLNSASRIASGDEYQITGRSLVLFALNRTARPPSR